MIKFIESKKTILESVLDRMMDRVDELVGKVNHECEYAGENGLRLYFSDTPKKVRAALDALESEFDVTLGGNDGEYYFVKIKKYEPEDKPNDDPAPEAKEEKYWVYKVNKHDKDVENNYMYVNSEGYARYRTDANHRKVFTKDQAGAKVGINNRKDNDYVWRMVPVTESVDTTEGKELYESVRVKMILENYTGTYELGDSLDEMISNLYDDEVDDTIALYKKIAQVLGVKDYNRVIGISAIDQADPDKLVGPIEEIEFDDARDLHVYQLHGVKLVREYYKPACATFLYFGSEDDCNDYLDGFDDDGSFDEAIVNEIKDSFGLTEDQVKNIIKRVKESIDKEGGR